MDNGFLMQIKSFVKKQTTTPFRSPRVPHAQSSIDTEQRAAALPFYIPHAYNSSLRGRLGII